MENFWSNYDTILFDLDGTLINSAYDLVHSLFEVLPKYHIELVPFEYLRPFAGIGSIAMIDAVVNYHKIEIAQELKDKIRASFLDAYEKNILTHTTPFDGAENLLSTLYNSGKRLILATNKPHKFTKIIIEHLGWNKYFKVLACSDTVSQRKPNPLHLLESMEQSGGISKKALMVGDSVADYEAALAVPMDIVMVSFYEQDKSLFPKATFHLDKFTHK